MWKDWVKWCIEFGIEANAIIAVPYDWRLSPSKLEERDLYFHKLKFVYILHSFFLALLFTGCDAHFLIDCFLVLELFQSHSVVRLQDIFACVLLCAFHCTFTSNLFGSLM